MDNTNNKDIYKRHDATVLDSLSADDGFVFVYKKTEKLATAIYMVTNLFSDAEPMKWNLRTKSSQMLSFIIGFKDILESREDEFSREAKTKVLEIVSLLEIAARSGLVSQMNFSILKSEFMNLIDFLAHFKKGSGHYFDLERNFFHVKPVAPPSIQEPTESSQGQPHVLDIYKRTNRQNIIMNLLKRKDSLTIHEIAETISDCSEKTIQRELISLIKAGLVKKDGERRWSRYSLGKS